MVGKDTVELERNKQGYEFANAKVIAEMKDIRQGMRLNGSILRLSRGKWLACGPPWLGEDGTGAGAVWFRHA